MDLIIARPKKSEGSFVCAIRQPFEISLSNAQLVHVKETNDDAQFAFMKNKPMYDYFYDLNARIVDIVKQNCGNWFNTNMNPDLIEDYYTNTLVYDKTHGDLIKLKIVGERMLPSDLVGTALNLTLSAKHLRFYKQKFVLELEIDTYETACDVIDFSSDDGDTAFDSDDEPYPSTLELKEMKEEVLAMADRELEALEAQLAEVESKIESVKARRKKMDDAVDPDEVIRLYNEIHE